MNDKTLYRIINLSSGDNLIAQVTESATKAITVYRPFQMKVITLLDEGGPLSVSFRKEALIFRNWLEFSTDQKVTIPRDKVISITHPNDMVSSLYDQEKEKEDNPKFMDDLLEKLIENVTVEIDPEDIRDIVHKMLEDSKNIRPIEHEQEDIDIDSDQDDDMFGW